MLALVHQRAVREVTIVLPQGAGATFALHSCSFTDAEGSASVIKDAGDDPDVTGKAEICARVVWSDQPGVTFRRGAGVGVVTKPGLPVPPGEPAINPVPRAMIRAAIEEVLNSVLRHAEETGLENRLDVRAAFCLEECEHGPNAIIDGEHAHHCTAKNIVELLNSRIGSDSKRRS